MNAVVEQIDRPMPMPAQKRTLMESFASKYQVEPGKMLDTLKATCFKGSQGKPATNEQLLALVAVANQFNLNPFLKEIYAFPDKQGGIIPVVGIDGWLRIVNEHPAYDGMDIVYAPTEGQKPPEWVECTIYRKDRSRPTVIREYLRECKRNTDPWNTSPTRMLRHRSIIQCARVSFSFGGIFEQDEAERIIDGGVSATVDAETVADINKRLSRPQTDLLPVGGDAEQKVEAKTDAVKAEAEQQADQPVMSFAQVADAINKSKTTDALDIAADLIGAVEDAGQRTELTDMYEQARKGMKS